MYNNKKFFKLDAKLIRDYFRSLGLTCVVGSMTGFFLKSHTSHQVISLGILLLIGTVFSYFGVKQENNHD